MMTMNGSLLFCNLAKKTNDSSFTSVLQDNWIALVAVAGVIFAMKTIRNRRRPTKYQW